MCTLWAILFSLSLSLSSEARALRLYFKNQNMTLKNAFETRRSIQTLHEDVPTPQSQYQTQNTFLFFFNTRFSSALRILFFAVA